MEGRESKQIAVLSGRKQSAKYVKQKATVPVMRKNAAPPTAAERTKRLCFSLAALAPPLYAKNGCASTRHSQLDYLPASCLVLSLYHTSESTAAIF